MTNPDFPEFDDETYLQHLANEVDPNIVRARVIGFAQTLIDTATQEPSIPYGDITVTAIPGKEGVEANSLNANSGSCLRVENMNPSFYQIDFETRLPLRGNTLYEKIHHHVELEPDKAITQSTARFYEGEIPGKYAMPIEELTLTELEKVFTEIDARKGQPRPEPASPKTRGVLSRFFRRKTGGQDT